MINWIKHNKGKVLLLGALGGCFCLAVLILFGGWSVQDIKDLVAYWVEEMNSWPAILFFLALVILPLIGFPVSPLILLASLRFGKVWGVPFCLSAIALNFIMAYVLSTKVLHRPIENLLKLWNYSIPKIKKENAARWVLLIRISGVPLVVQNYTLGLAHPPFLTYLWVSMAVQGLFVVGLCIVGPSFMSGNIPAIIAGVAVLVVAVLLVSFLKKRYAKSKPGTVSDTEG